MQTNLFFEKLLSIFREVFDDESLYIDLESSPDTVEGWDSMRNLLLVHKIEEVFQVKFKQYELLSMQTVEDIIEALERRKNI